MKASIFFFLAGSALLLSQEVETPLWAFSRHPINEEKTYEDITAIIAAGYAIGGIEVQDGEIELLSYFYPENTPKNWFFASFTDLQEMEDELSALMLANWYPLDIAWGKDLIYAFLEKRLDEKPLRWRLDVVDTIGEIAPMYNDYRSKGYLFTALSVSPDGRFWLLFTEYENQGSDTSLLRLHQIPGDEAGILAQLSQKRFPRAMMRAGDQYYILYRQ